MPTLCYQCQTWTLTAEQKRKITTTEMRCLRRIMNVSILDKIRNETIRETIKVSPALDYIKRQQLKWYGHVARSSINSLAQRAITLRCNRKRGRGRPGKRWIDEITDISMLTIQQTHQSALARNLHFPSMLRG